METQSTTESSKPGVKSVSSPQEKSKPPKLIIERALPAALLATIAGKDFSETITASGYYEYLERFYAAAGYPSDPMVQALISQFVVANLSAGKLHAESACAETCEAKVALAQAASKLMAECRKTFETINASRRENAAAAIAPSVVLPANAPVESPCEIPSAQVATSRADIASPTSEVVHRGKPTHIAARGRPTKPFTTKANNPRRATKASRHGACQPA